MNSYNDDGKEFVQGIFSKGKSFGEPPLFGEFVYPANAVSMGQTSIWRLPKNSFLELLEKHPEVHMNLPEFLPTG